MILDMHVTTEKYILVCYPYLSFLLLINRLLIKKCMTKEEHDVERQGDETASEFSIKECGTIIIISETSNEPRRTCIITYEGHNNVTNTEEKKLEAESMTTKE
ncbi:hypothetical protein XENTR_v10011401 [Xenopus tropicalis]|nr:hypothetical protein XENTR_v10011401 [Xenopus tropicalis]